MLSYRRSAVWHQECRVQEIQVELRQGSTRLQFRWSRGLKRSCLRRRPRGRAVRRKDVHTELRPNLTSFDTPSSLCEPWVSHPALPLSYLLCFSTSSLLSGIKLFSCSLSVFSQNTAPSCPLYSLGHLEKHLLSSGPQKITHEYIQKMKPRRVGRNFENHITLFEISSLCLGKHFVNVVLSLQL